nr:MAG TPA: hypothetical protein [Bacteriophage sp.]
MFFFLRGSDSQVIKQRDSSSLYMKNISQTLFFRRIISK